MRKQYAALSVEIPANLTIVQEPTFLSAMQIAQGKLVLKNERGISLVIGAPVMRGQSECTILWLGEKGEDLAEANIFASFSDVQDAINALAANKIPSEN